MDDSEIKIPEIVRDAEEINKMLQLTAFSIREESPIIPEDKAELEQYVRGLNQGLAWVLGYPNASASLEESLAYLEAKLAEHHIKYCPIHRAVEAVAAVADAEEIFYPPGDPSLN
jgi:hypothetical protein